MSGMVTHILDWRAFWCFWFIQKFFKKLRILGLLHKNYVLYYNQHRETKGFSKSSQGGYTSWDVKVSRNPSQRSRSPIHIQLGLSSTRSSRRISGSWSTRTSRQTSTSSGTGSSTRLLGSRGSWSSCWSWSSLRSVPPEAPECDLWHLGSSDVYLNCFQDRVS